MKAVLAGLIVAAMSSTAMAGGNWSVGIGFGSGHSSFALGYSDGYCGGPSIGFGYSYGYAPVYVTPRPIYYAPRPLYYGHGYRHGYYRPGYYGHGYRHGYGHKIARAPGVSYAPQIVSATSVGHRAPDRALAAPRVVYAAPVASAPAITSYARPTALAPSPPVVYAKPAVAVPPIPARVVGAPTAIAGVGPSLAPSGANPAGRYYR